MVSNATVLAPQQMNKKSSQAGMFFAGNHLVRGDCRARPEREPTNLGRIGFSITLGQVSHLGAALEPLEKVDLLPFTVISGATSTPEAEPPRSESESLL